MNSPNFNGVCCRICEFPDIGWREWQCFRVSSDQGFTDEELNNIPWLDNEAMDNDNVFHDYMIFKRDNHE